MDNLVLITAIFGAFFLSVVFFSILKKFFYFFVLKKKIYIIPHLSIKGIGYLAIIIALSVTIVIILTIYTKDFAAIFFRAFPGARITFESLLIKVGGLLLGPFLGIVLGAATDGLTIIFTAGVFHYGYFIAAMAFGLLGGLIRIMIMPSKNNHRIFYIGSNILIIFATLFVCFFYTFTQFTLTGGSLSAEDVWQNLNTMAIIPIINIKLRVLDLLIIMGGFSIFTLIMFNSFYFLSLKSQKKFFKDQFVFFGPALLLSFLSEIFISIFLLPIVDFNLVSSISYASWFAVRILVAFPLLIFNLIVIWPIYKSISSIFKYDYLSDYEVDDLQNMNVNYQFNDMIKNQEKDLLLKSISAIKLKNSLEKRRKIDAKSSK